mmetsp:Transcript_24724/g.42397  ORF Transcript_24724/g.42397 Transcript_24724/m.42397 type:complete len:81 (+) Transcript_24724:257-499(+)
MRRTRVGKDAPTWVSGPHCDIPTKTTQAPRRHSNAHLPNRPVTVTPIFSAQQVDVLHDKWNASAVTCGQRMLKGAVAGGQ